MLECTGLGQSQVTGGNMALCAPATDISSKLAALIQNRDALRGTPFALSTEEFDKARLDILTSRFV